MTIPSRLMQVLRYLAVFVVCGAVWLPAYAQNADITGAVMDPQGLAVPGASITVTNQSTDIHREAVSSGTGSYRISSLEPGTYSIRVQKDGFETLERTGVTLFVATVTRLDLRIGVGHSDQTVTVNGDASLLQTENAQISTSVNKNQYDDLPLVQQGRIRSPVSFVYLAPTVQGNYTTAGAENTAATNSISVNGSQTGVTELYLSGLSAGQPANQSSFNESAMPVDATQEFKIVTTMLPADYGHTGAAAGFFAIRNGTNQWHGSAYEYLRNNILDAQPWGAIIPLWTRQNEFGATIGGPVILPKLYDGRNRSFFFFSYGGSRKSGVDSLSTLKIPTPAEIAGDFSGQATIYDPATTRLNATGTGYIRDPFPGNKIPADRLDPLAAKIASYYPAPNAAGVNNYQAYAGERLLNPDVETARVDHQLRPSQNLFFTLVQTRIPRLLVNTPLPEPLASNYVQFLRATTIRVNHDWLINSHAMNSAAIGYYRIYATIQPTGEEYSIPNQISSVRPIITFSNGYPALSNETPNKTAQYQYQLRDVIYWSKGSHNLRIGGEWRRPRYDNNSPNPGLSSAAMSNLETANPNSSSTTGDGFASFLLGQVNSGSLSASLPKAYVYSYGGVFLQDDWKLSKRLTMNLGIRWEYQKLPSEADGDRSSIISLDTPNPGAGNLAGALIYAGSGEGRTGGHIFAPNKYTAVSPRIGLSFAVNPKVVARAGFGIFYSDLGMFTGISTYGFAPSASFTTPDNGITPAFTLSSGYPAAPSLQPQISPTLINGQSGNYWDSSIGNMPYVEQWNASVQFSPSSNWMLEIAYVGNTSHHLINSSFANINQIDPKYLSLGPLLTVSASSAAAKNAGIVLPYAGFSGTVAQALRPYPQYQTLTSVAAKIAYSNYNSLQVMAERRFSHGLRFSANYVFSRNLGVSGGLQNSFNPSAEYSLSSLDIPHALVLNYTYNLPIGKGKAFLSQGKVANALAGGWKISAIQRYQSGYPLFVTMNNPLPIFNRQMRPDVVSGMDRTTHLSKNEYRPGGSPRINPHAFAMPAAFTFGDAAPAYSDLRDPSIYSEDISVVKETPITEKITWNLYGSFFNAFNRHRFTGFSTNLSNSNFGTSSGVSQPRLIQIGTRLQF